MSAVVSTEAICCSLLAYQVEPLRLFHPTVGGLRNISESVKLSFWGKEPESMVIRARLNRFTAVCWAIFMHGTICVAGWLRNGRVDNFPALHLIFSPSLPVLQSQKLETRVTIPAFFLNQNEQIRTKPERHLYKLFNFHSSVTKTNFLCIYNLFSNTPTATPSSSGLHQ